MKYLIAVLMLSACAPEPEPVDLSADDPDVARAVCPDSGEIEMGGGPVVVLAWECGTPCAPLDLVWVPERWDYVAQCSPGLDVVVMAVTP